MVQVPKNLNVNVMWKGRKFVLELSSDASLKELGEELQALTDVKADTLKLIIPQSSTKTSKLFMPFSDDHSCIRLQDTGIAEGKPLRMMGVYEHEVDQLLKDAKANLRIAGFEEEERRMKQRISRGPQASLKFPQGPYIFCDFRRLELPGVQLNPPPSEALKLMHMLASDPGIVAIMNKHHWRVGIMTEMAPVGYVGISPKCLLGFNKNRGEEISLRLRTDDLKGFRKYESIKKTLLHELAHMVYSEHDSNFYALDKQLNQEAFSLDWTRSRGYTLSDTQITGHDDMEIDFESESSLPQKLGGTGPYMAVSAREASVAAAYHRFADSSTISQVSENHGESESVSSEKEDLPVRTKLDGCYQEPDPDDSGARESMNSEPYAEANEGITQVKLDPSDTELGATVPKFTSYEGLESAKLREEPDPDDSDVSGSSLGNESRTVDTQTMQIETNAKSVFKTLDEPDPDDLEARRDTFDEPDPDDLGARKDQLQPFKVHTDQDPDDAQEVRMERAEPDPDDKSEPLSQIMGLPTDEPDPDDQELRRIQDPVNVFCNQLTKAIETLRSDESRTVDTQTMQIETNAKSVFKTFDEPDPDDLEARRETFDEPDPDDLGARKDQLQPSKVHTDRDPDDAQEVRMERAEPDPDDKSEPLSQIMGLTTDEPDLDDQELRRIQDPVNVFCNQLTKAIETLRSDVSPLESKAVLETLYKIIRNVSESPNEMRYKKLRKANPVFQRSIAYYKAAMEILSLIGFNEDIVTDETGKSETYLVLKRNDPGLVWLAKSTFEKYIS